MASPSPVDAQLTQALEHQTRTILAELDKWFMAIDSKWEAQVGALEPVALQVHAYQRRAQREPGRDPASEVVVEHAQLGELLAVADPSRDGPGEGVRRHVHHLGADLATRQAAVGVDVEDRLRHFDAATDTCIAALESTNQVCEIWHPRVDSEIEGLQSRVADSERACLMAPMSINAVSSCPTASAGEKMSFVRQEVHVCFSDKVPVLSLEGIDGVCRAEIHAHKVCDIRLLHFSSLLPDHSILAELEDRDVSEQLAGARGRLDNPITMLLGPNIDPVTTPPHLCGLCAELSFSSPTSSLLQLVCVEEEEVLTTSPNRCLTNCFNLIRSCFSRDAMPHRQPWPPPHMHVEFGCASDRMKQYNPKLISTTTNKHEKEKEMASVLLPYPYGELVHSTQIKLGFVLLLEVVEDLAIDTNVIELFMAHTILDDILPLAFLSKAKVSLSGSSMVMHLVQIAEKNYFQPTS
jgi:hypothetical protein